jgi:hypothetical protein
MEAAGAEFPGRPWRRPGWSSLSSAPCPVKRRRRRRIKEGAPQKSRSPSTMEAPPPDLHGVDGEVAGSLSTGECASTVSARQPPSRRGTAPAFFPVHRSLTGPTGGRAGKVRAERETRPRRNRARERVSRPIRGRSSFARPFGGTASCETAHEAAREAVPPEVETQRDAGPRRAFTRRSSNWPGSLGYGGTPTAPHRNSESFGEESWRSRSMAMGDDDARTIPGRSSSVRRTSGGAGARPAACRRGGP